jgi:hypothetical protein
VRAALDAPRLERDRERDKMHHSQEATP